jgi:uncharacterized protein YjbJ (UPF0337 family)
VWAQQSPETGESMKAHEDKIKGNLNSLFGKVKQLVGKAIKDKGLERRGFIQKEKGKGQKMRGVMSDSVQKSSHVMGNAVKEAGKKIKKGRIS